MAAEFEIVIWQFGCCSMTSRSQRDDLRELYQLIPGNGSEARKILPCVDHIPSLLPGAALRVLA
jgi:hypothetical protein